MRAGLAAVTSGATESLGAVVESVETDMDAALDQYWAQEEGRRTAMQEFRQAIEELARPADQGPSGANVVFVVDELDRCRPDYALEVLEVIKHLFTVPHLHFVLGVNIHALESMITTRYGPDIDAHRYLGKFIQVKFDFPNEIRDGNQKTSVLAYMDHLAGQMGLQGQVYNGLKGEIEIVARSNLVTLRDIGAIISSLALANGNVVQNPNGFSHGWIDVMITLIISRTIRPDLHPKFLDASIDADDLKSYLGTNDGELTPGPKGNYEDNQKRKVSFKYYTWLFVAQGDDFKKCPDCLQYIPQRFEFSQSTDDLNSIPMEVNRNWLDRFSFFASQDQDGGQN